MTETIIKGTGNSRSIRSVANIAQLAPTHEALLALLAGDGLPVDIGGLNEEGCQQIGDALNKANLLKDPTAALYGLPATAVPDEVLAAIRPLITAAHNAVKAASGSYSGTGQNSGKTISVGFNARAFFMITNKAIIPGGFSNGMSPIWIGVGSYITRISGYGSGYAEAEAAAGIISGPVVKLNDYDKPNVSGATYYWAAFG